MIVYQMVTREQSIYRGGDQDTGEDCGQDVGVKMDRVGEGVRKQRLAGACSVRIREAPAAP